MASWQELNVQLTWSTPVFTLVKVGVIVGHAFWLPQAGKSDPRKNTMSGLRIT
jgi:hypothetical protein